MSHATGTGVIEPSALSDEIRDGLLQDLVAVAMLLRHAQQTGVEAAERDLAAASAALQTDVEVVRGLIDRLRAA